MARVRRAISFVAIVWTIAASFVVIELAAQAIFERLIENDAVSHLTVSGETSQSKTCDAGGRERLDVAPRPVTPEGRAWAWLLGVDVGRSALMRRGTAEGPARQIESTARLLGIPPPAPLAVRNDPRAIEQFRSFIEGEDTTTSSLTSVYSTEVCQLYKLGAFWGYSALFQETVPGKVAIFALEIQYYAEKVGLPRRLWESMVTNSSATATAEERARSSLMLTDSVTDYWRTAR